MNRGASLSMGSAGQSAEAETDLARIREMTDTTANPVTLMVPRVEGGALVPRLRRFTVTGVFEVGMQELDGILALVSLGDAAGIAGGGFANADDVLVNGFQAPEAASGEDRFVGQGVGGKQECYYYGEKNWSVFHKYLPEVETG